MNLLFSCNLFEWELNKTSWVNWDATEHECSIKADCLLSLFSVQFEDQGPLQQLYVKHARKSEGKGQVYGVETPSGYTTARGTPLNLKDIEIQSQICNIYSAEALQSTANVMNWGQSIWGRS
jgi:hypothetical protein